MIAKSLTWCQYSTGWFNKNSDKYLLPGQAVPLEKGVILKQIRATYSDSDLLLTNCGLVDLDKVITSHKYVGAFLPEKRTVLSELIYRGKNYAMIGDNNNLLLPDVPVVQEKTLKAADWANTAGSLVELEEDHSLYVCVIANADEAANEVWCPTKQKFVRLKIIDVPIAFCELSVISNNPQECYWIYERTPYLDQEWWIWNAITTTGSQKVGDKNDWLSDTETYVNVVKNLPNNLDDYNYFKLIDVNFRRLSGNKKIPPKSEFAVV